MPHADLFVAFLVALLLTPVFLVVLGWLRTTRRIMAGRLVLFFLVVWLGTWGLGGWIEPVGPLLWDVPFLVHASIGAAIAVTLAASAPPVLEHGHEADPAPPGPLGAFFWVLLVLLVLAVVGRYTLAW